MIDIARSFKPKEWIFELLDAMAMYKLNKLHLHLSDDGAWRLEIPEIPELTEVASCLICLCSNAHYKMLVTNVYAFVGSSTMSSTAVTHPAINRDLRA